MNESLLKNNFLYIPEFICPDLAESLAIKFKEDSENNNLPGDYSSSWWRFTLVYLDSRSK